MLQLASNYEQIGTTQSESKSVPQFDLLALARIVRRRWRMMCLVLITGLVLGTTYMIFAPRRYTADVSILVVPTKDSPLSRDDSTVEKVLDPGVVESQVEVLKSDTVALAAVRALGLDKKPQEEDHLPAFIVAILNFLDPPAPGAETQTPEEHAVQKIAKQLKVQRVGVTYVLTLSYTDTDPVMAAKVANALADAYMDNQLEARYQATRRAADWLQTRLKTLRTETSAAEAAVQKFKVENGIVDTAKGLLSDQQLSDATTQLASARNEAAAAKARLDRIQEVLASSDSVNATVSDALKDDVLNRLRAQYLDLSAREADLSARYGPTHGAVVNLRNQMAEINKTARDELKRLAESSRSDYEIALNNERALKATMDSLLSQADATSAAQVKLRDLESSAQTYRNLYDNMLEKLQQTTQEQTSPDESARIIDPASPPDRASSPKLLIVYVLSVVLSLALGCALALVRELMGNGFKTAEDVKNYAGLSCIGTLPRIHVSRPINRSLRAAAAAAGQSILGGHSALVRQSVLAPFSRFTETIRSVKVSIDISRPGRSGSVTGVISSVPKEGKTTFSINLAFVTAQMGHRTLLIDGDMHNPSMTRTLANQAKLGLIEVLEGKCSLQQALVRDSVTGLDFLPAVVPQRKPNAVSLLTSEAMSALLAQVRQEYDYVIFDLAPIVPVVDVKAAAFMFDGFIFVVEWGRTSRDVVRDALLTSEQVRERVIGVVLNKADAGELKRLESYRGPAYDSYYVESGAS